MVLIYSKKEQAQQLTKMRQLLNEFQAKALATKVLGLRAHAQLVELFVTICERTRHLPEGDFNNTNHPAGEPLDMTEADAENLAETLAAIYGTTMASNSRCMQAFVATFTRRSEEALRRLKGD